MSQQNVEIVRAFFDAALVTPEDAAAFLADDAEFLPLGHFGAAAPGPQGFHQRIADISDQFAEYEVRPTEFRARGDLVAVALERHARSARSTVDLTDRFAQVFGLRDGEIVRIESYPSFDEALEALAG